MQMLVNIIKSNQKFIKHNLFSYFVIVFNILTSLYAVRQNLMVLHQDLYGIWILVFSTCSLLGMFHFGFGTVGIFLFKKYKDADDLSSFFSSNFLIISIQLFLTLIVVFFLIFFRPFYIQENLNVDVYRQLLLLSLPGILITAVSTYFEAILYYNLKFIYHRNIVELLRLGVLNILFVFGLSFWSDVRVLPIVYSLVALIVFLLTVSKFLRREKIVFRASDVKVEYIFNNFKDSMSFWVLSLSTIVIAQMDVFFISMMKENVGLVTMYSQSFRLQDISLKFIKKISEIKSPKILSLLQQNNKIAVRDIFNKLLIVSLVLSVLASVFISFFGKLILEVWLSGMIDFDQKIIIATSILCITGSLHFVLWNFCNLSGLQGKVKIVTIVEIAINLILSFFFMRRFGLVGLPLASVVSNSITIVYVYVMFLQFGKGVNVSN